MKVRRLAELSETGKKFFVRIGESLWDESFGEPGMIAELVSVHKDDTFGNDNDYNMTLDFSKFREHNMALAATDFYLIPALASKLNRDTGNAIEAECIKEDLIEEVLWNNDDDLPVILVDDESLMGMFIKAEFKGTYAEWLEKQLRELMPGLIDIIDAMAKGNVLTPEARALLTNTRILYTVFKHEDSLIQQYYDEGRHQNI